MMTLTQEIAVAEAEGRRVGWRGWAALVVLMLPVMLVSVDNTVLSFALPEIGLALQPTSLQQLWIVDAYSLVIAGLLVTMGALGDRFGRRRMLLIGATGFALVSGAAAFAPSAEWLIAARAAMAVFGAMIMPATLSSLRTVFTDRDQRRLAIAVWASGFSAGSALGPVIGGVLLEHFAWGSVFLMAIPVLIPLLILAPMLLPESRNPRPGRIDLISVALSMAMMIPIVYAIKEFAVHGPSGAIVVLTVAGLVAGILFVRRQLRLPVPLLDMRLFTRSAFSGALIVNLLSIMGFVGFLYFVAQYLQLIEGASPFQSGLALVPGLLATIVSGLAIVPVARRVAPRVIVPAVLVFTVLGYALVAIAATRGDVVLLISAFVLMGLGLGAAQTVSNELVQASSPPAKAGAASAVSESAYELGTVLGTAVLGGLVTAVYRGHLAIPVEAGAAVAAASRETLAGAFAAAETLPAELGAMLQDAAVSAFTDGVVIAAAVGAGLMIVAAVVAATTLGDIRRNASR